MDENSVDVIEKAKALCEKFVNKVESRKARSQETYADCKALLKVIYGDEEKLDNGQ